MIKLSFSIKRNPGKKGVIRLRSLSSDKNRVRNGQLVITQDGLGTIKEYMAKKDEQGRLELPHGVNVAVRNLKHKERVYKLSDVNVVDIIDAKTGDKYPAAESDYQLLLVDDVPVEFIVTRKKRAMITEKSRKELGAVKIFAKKQNGIKILNQLIKDNIWNPIRK